MLFLPEDPKERKYVMLGLRIVTDFTITLALPVIIFAAVGQWLDMNYNTDYWFTAVGIILAALITAKIILKKAEKYGQEYEQLGDHNQQDNKKD